MASTSHGQSLILFLLVAWVPAACSEPELSGVGRSTRRAELPEAHTESAPPIAAAVPKARAGFVSLDVPGFRPAVVFVPERPNAPLLVATHGAGGDPESHCEFWRIKLRETAFVLCPRGRALDARLPEGASGYYYPDHKVLERELRASLAAFQARFPGASHERPAYAGFSQGATMGILILPKLPFTRIVLAEGGYDGWTVALARSFKAAKGERVLFVCGTRSCAREGRAAASYLEKAGVGARVVAASGAGHTMGGAVEEGLLAALPWLFGGDPRFSAVAE